MTIALLFWIVFLLAVLFNGFAYWSPSPGRAAWAPLGSWAFVLIEIGLLGWRVFGPAIR